MCNYVCMSVVCSSRVLHNTLLSPPNAKGENGDCFTHLKGGHNLSVFFFPHLCSNKQHEPPRPTTNLLHVSACLLSVVCELRKRVVDKIGVSIYKQVQNIAAFIIFSGAVVILLSFSSMFLCLFVC